MRSSDRRQVYDPFVHEHYEVHALALLQPKRAVAGQISRLSSFCSHVQQDTVIALTAPRTSAAFHSFGLLACVSLRLLRHARRGNMIRHLAIVSAHRLLSAGCVSTRVSAPPSSVGVLCN